MSLIQAKISTKNQLVIPKTIRFLLGLNPGDLVTFTRENGKIYITKAKPE